MTPRPKGYLKTSGEARRGGNRYKGFTRMRKVIRKIPTPSNLLGFTLVIGMMGGCNTTVMEADAQKDALFSPVKNVIPFEDRKRRKFDNAVIADLDRDGFQEVIINEHGRHMKVFWNDKGNFSKGPVIANGDVHGAAVGDFDKNGDIDVIITQGGGDGKNPRRPLWVEVTSDREIIDHGDFNYFEPGRGRVSSFLKSPMDQALNLLVTGFATPEQTMGANHYYANMGGGKFKFQEHLPNADRLGFRATTTDFNDDRIDDVVIFGAENVRIAKGNIDGSFTDVTEAAFGDESNILNVTSVTEIDFDNDGDFDLFFSRAEFPFSIETDFNPETRRFAFLTFRKDFLFEDMKIEGDLSLTNLQRTYPNYNIYMGINKTPFSFGDKVNPHGHQDISINPGEAQGWPEGELKGGLYVGHLGDGIWRIGGQTHSRWAAVVERVMSNPTVKESRNMPAVLLENRGGTFYNVTESSGILVDEQTSSAAAADFNNDGHVDLVILRKGDMSSVNEHLLYLNNGDGTFTITENAGIWADEVGTTGGSIEPFDYNVDGNVDIIFSNERGRWHLLKNSGKGERDGNAITLDVSKAELNGLSPLGVAVSVSACGKIVKRKVGSGSAAYSQGLNTKLHFGLGACSEIDTVTLDVQGAVPRTLTSDELSELVIQKTF